MQLSTTPWLVYKTNKNKQIIYIYRSPVEALSANCTTQIVTSEDRVDSGNEVEGNQVGRW